MYIKKSICDQGLIFISVFFYCLFVFEAKNLDLTSQQFVSESTCRDDVVQDRLMPSRASSTPEGMSYVRFCISYNT